MRGGTFAPPFPLPRSRPLLRASRLTCVEQCGAVGVRVVQWVGNGGRGRGLRLTLRLRQVHGAVGGVWARVVWRGRQGGCGRALRYGGRRVAAHGRASMTIHTAQLRHHAIVLREHVGRGLGSRPVSRVPLPLIILVHSYQQ